MTNIILFDDSSRNGLLPFTFTRPIADIRVGIITIREKWEHHLQASASVLTEKYLSQKYPLHQTADNLLITASALPNPDLVKAVEQLELGEALTMNGDIIAARMPCVENYVAQIKKRIEYKGSIVQLKQNYDIFRLNEQELAADFVLLCAHRKSVPLSKTNIVIGNPEHIFLEEGAIVEAATLNCQQGYIYIGKESEIMENSVIRAPFALCDHATIKMGAKIYGATTVGRYCKVGGELNNVLFFDYSNKAHDGFLGNAVIGEWCNLGADTNASNLKNNYANIKIWDYDLCKFMDRGLQFCGTLMGDHTKCGISSMFNSGTVIGVGCNLFGHGYHRNFIQSFSYGSPQSGYENYRIDKVIDAAKMVFARRNKIFDETEEAIFRHLAAIE